MLKVRRQLGAAFKILEKVAFQPLTLLKQAISQVAEQNKEDNLIFARSPNVFLMQHL